MLYFVYSQLVSFPKMMCSVSLGTLMVLGAAFFVMTDVSASGLHDVDLPLESSVPSDTLTQAERFAGEYRFVGGQREADGIDAAIEASADALSPMLRGLGRKKLKATNPVPKGMRIAVKGDVLELTIDGKGFKAGLDGKPDSQKSSEGDAVKVSFKFRDGKLVQFIDGAKGDRHNYIRLSEDGNRLTMKVKVSSSHLPVPVEYKLTFKRK